MSDTASKRKGIKTAETVFDILETIGEGECTTVSTVANRLDYSKSTIHYYLKTLEEKRYVIEEGGQYRLGLRTASLGSKAMEHYTPRGFIQERTDDLARETETAADVVVEEAGEGVVLHRSRTDEDRLVDTYVGMPVDLHATAFGKVILAFSPSERRDELLSSRDPGESADRPPAERGVRLEELEKVRQVGLAYAEDGVTEGLASIAAPITRESNGELYGAIGIWGRADRMVDPTRHPKARRFAGDTTEEVEKVARIIGNRL